jgi:hypothetical protein
VPRRPGLTTKGNCTLHFCASDKNGVNKNEKKNHEKNNKTGADLFEK